MNLSEVTKNIMVKIVSIDAPSILKKRLASLGICEGKEVQVLEATIQRNTIKVGIGSGFVALRLDEAKSISVKESV